MYGKSWPTLSVLAMLLGAFSAVAKEPVTPPDPADTEELLRQADDLWHIQADYDGALAAFNKAVDAAPKDGTVRLRRAQFFEVVSHIVKKEDQETFGKMAREDYQWITDDQPDTRLAGVARDGLTRLSGKNLLETASVTCPDEAVQAHGRAESLYGARHFPEAVVQYEMACTACPSAAAYWVDYADAYYGMEEYEKAEELFRKALEIDPWNRAGHRFLADTEWRLNNSDAALHESALAVISDPIYEAAWSSLKNYAEVTGRGWHRIYGKKTEVTAGVEQDGKPSITISIPEEKPSAEKSKRAGRSKSKAAAKNEAASSDSAAWMMYGMSKALVLEGTVMENDPFGKSIERKVDPKAMTALEIDRIAVNDGITVMQEMSGEHGPFWSMMTRARQSGFLDEAIFLHMLDGPLAAEYPAFRDEHAARLAEYLETVVVPKK